MSLRKHVLATAAIGAAATVVLAGCSGGGDDDGLASKSADQIQESARKAMKSAKSMSFDAKMTQNGKPMTMKMSMEKGAGKCTGTISMGTGTAQILKIGEDSYIKADKQFWTDNAGSASQADAIVNLLGDRWMKMEPGDDSFTSACDLAQFQKSMKKSKDAKLSKGEEGTVDGTKTIAIKEKKKDETTTLQVATEGKPYVLKLVTKGDEPGTATFSDFNEPVKAKAPATSDVLDASKLR
ncbi:hypothetical protein [Streptomyces boninensis]|uniref:hypothetical protein n=1 Tax=Streptomyces boninensis TaxID=2039455 RepID=UPI003B21F575